MYHPVEDLKGLTIQPFDAVCDKHPLVRVVYDLIWELKMIFKNYDVERLDEWVEKAQSLEIKELSSFMNGLKRDLEAVRNVCIHEINNGLAEGFVNKIKVIKRMMYGRCNFDNLKHKTLAIEKMKDFN